MNNSNQRKIGTILTYLNLAISFIIPLFYTPVMLEILGQENYGVSALSSSVTGYLSLLNLGLGTALVRSVTKARAQGNEDSVRNTIGLFITIYSILAVLVLICGAVLTMFADTFFGNGLTPDQIIQLRWLMIIMSISTALSFPLGVFGSIVGTYERFLTTKLCVLAETILSPVLFLIVLYLGFGTIGLALVYIPILIATAVWMGIYAYKKLNIYPVFKNMPFHILKELAVFCAFVMLSSIVDMLYWATDKVLIGAMIGAAAVAIYNVGGTFTSILQRMALAISSIFSPRINTLVAQNAPSDVFSELMIRIGRLQYLIVAFVLSGYIVFGRHFIHFWTGDVYAEAYYIALLTMIPLCIPLIQNVAFTVILAMNKHKFRSIVYAIIAVVNVISTYLLLPYYGIIGAAVCTAVSFLLGQGIVMNIYYHRVIKLDIPAFWGNIARISIVPAVMIPLGLYLVHNVLPMTSLVWFLVWVAVYSIVYIIAIWLTSMNQYEKSLVSSMIKKLIPHKKAA